MASDAIEMLKQVAELGMLAKEWQAKAVTLQKENAFLKELLLQKEKSRINP